MHPNNRRESPIAFYGKRGWGLEAKSKCLMTVVTFLVCGLFCKTIKKIFFISAQREICILQEEQSDVMLIGSVFLGQLSCKGNYWV